MVDKVKPDDKTEYQNHLIPQKPLDFKIHIPTDWRIGKWQSRRGQRHVKVT